MVVNLWVEGEDAEARLALSGGKFKLNLSLDGEPTISDSNAHSFGSYYFGYNNPIFTIKDGEKLDVTMVAWLEGGDLIKKGENKGSIRQNFVGKSVSMFINFETNWDNMDNIEFVDDTKGDVDTSVRHWINTDNCGKRLCLRVY